MLTLENQLSHPEALSAWSRSDMRAKWRADVASGGLTVTANMWEGVLSRMADMGVAIKAELASAWLPLCAAVAADASTGLATTAVAVKQEASPETP